VPATRNTYSSLSQRSMPFLRELLGPPEGIHGIQQIRPLSLH